MANGAEGGRTVDFNGQPPSSGPDAHMNSMNPKVSAQHDVPLEPNIRDKSKASMYQASVKTSRYVLGKGRPD